MHTTFQQQKSCSLGHSSPLSHRLNVQQALKVAAFVAVLLCLVMTNSSSSSSSAVAAATATAPTLTKRRTTKRLAPQTPSAFFPQNYSVEQQQPAAKQPPPRPTRNATFLWSSFVAGVGSGILASIVCAPLDVLRTRLQVWGDLHPSARKGGLHLIVQEIVQVEGIKGAFRGLGATLLTVPMFWGIYFPLYNDLKQSLQTPQRNVSVVHCISAVLAGAAADVVCNPFFLVRTRLQTEALHGTTTPSGILQTVRQLYSEGGPLVFWRGMTASLFGLSHVAIQFPCYEFLKDRARQQSPHGKETPLDLLVASGLSKMCASLLTYPHEVVRARMMDARTKQSLTNTVQRIYLHEGLGGFYTGLPISLVRVLPNCCITFMTYELLLRWSKQQMEQQQNEVTRKSNKSAVSSWT